MPDNSADYALSSQVFRQSDAEFIGILNRFRLGICDEGAADFLKGCGTALDGLSNIKVSPIQVEATYAWAADLSFTPLISPPTFTYVTCRSHRFEVIS